MRTIHGLILAAIVIIGAGLRVYHLTRSPLSFDELGSMETAAGRGQAHLVLPRNIPLPNQPVLTRLSGSLSTWSVPFHLQSDVHPPLYFLSLRCWLDLFGDSDAAARSLSILAGIAGIILIFDTGRLLRDPATGLWAAAIMAVAQPQIIESQDARPYALAIALSLAAWNILIRVERYGISRQRLLAMTVAILATALAHYYTAGVPLAMGIYAAIRLRGPAMKGIFAAFAVATLLGIALWGRAFLQQTDQSTFNGQWMYWFDDRVPNHVALTLQRFATLPLRYLAEPIAGSSQSIAMGAAVLYALPFLFARRRQEMLLCGLWLVCAAGLVTTLDLVRHTSQMAMVKYTLMASPAVYLMLPLLFKSPHWLGAVAVLCALLALPDAHHDAEDNWRAIAVDVQNIPPDQPLLIDSATWGDWYGGMLFMGTQRYADHLPRTVIIVAPSDLETQLHGPFSRQPVWLLMAGNITPPQAATAGRKAASPHQYQGMANLIQLFARTE